MAQKRLLKNTSVLNVCVYHCLCAYSVCVCVLRSITENYRQDSLFFPHKNKKKYTVFQTVDSHGHVLLSIIRNIIYFIFILLFFNLIKCILYKMMYLIFPLCLGLEGLLCVLSFSESVFISELFF